MYAAGRVVDGEGRQPGADGGDQPSEPPVRVCPDCSAQSATFSDNCPHCGASFIRSRRRRARRRLGSWSRRRKVAALLIVATLIGGAVAAGVIIKVNHDNQVAEQHQEEQEARELAEKRQAEREADEQAEIREERQAERELARIEAKFGQESVSELEDAITEDANEEAEEGFSEYVSGTNCEAEGGRVNTALTAQNFTCLAITDEEGGTQSGYRYSGTINYVKGTLTWRLGG